MSLAQKYGPRAGEELQGVFDALKAHADCTGKVGSVGFCFGGRMALTLALARRLDAVCTFYGGGMQQLFDRTPATPSFGTAIRTCTGPKRPGMPGSGRRSSSPFT